jgi:8-oxo-dGTP pyrophosphatase MutT (NUDIX family)
VKQPKLKPNKLSLKGFGKRGVRTQFAALCYRYNDKGKLRICLVTSRRSKRWILPKGWPMNGRTPGRAAAIEAYEEAGVKGRVSEQSLGIFDYRKKSDPTQRPYLAIVYPLKVKTILKKYPERQYRKRKWFSRKKAAAKVSEPGLRAIILAFDPTKK